MESNNQAQWADFMKLDIRSGTILSAEPLENARKPAYKLVIDFGPLGHKRSSAQLTKLYTCEDLPGKKIIAVVNFPVKQIGSFMSECLVLGTVNGDEVTLLTTDLVTENGLKIG